MMLLFCSLALTAGTPSAPCGTLELTDGAARTGLALRASAPLGAETRGCVRHIGGELRARAGLRSVTVTVRVGDAGRADGSGAAAVAAVVDELVAAGLPRARVSGVVATGEGDVRISFAERAGAASVGRLGIASGDVRVGPSAATATAASTGAPLPPESFVVTGPGASALLELADRSKLRLHPDTVVHLQRLQLNDKLQRLVQLAVPRGAVDVVAAPGGPGSSFDIKTPFATAGVRGTAFRVVASEGTSSASSMRLETLEGAVELTGSKGSTRVEHGFGSRVDEGGAPSVPAALPAAPVPTAPLRGERAVAGLTWAAVAGAVGYRVEVARDAELVIDAQTIDATTTTAATTTLAPGPWFWRVSARSAEGFVGESSQTFKFHVGP